MAKFIYDPTITIKVVILQKNKNALKLGIKYERPNFGIRFLLSSFG
jgi:hypothetical protein